MSLSDYLIKLGNIFFRWRSYIPLALIPLLLLKSDSFSRVFSNRSIDAIYDILCLLISFLGEFTRVMTIGFIPPGTSGRNTKSQRATFLNTTGTYSITRNPLYLGNYLIITGIILVSRSWELAIINSLLFVIFYIPIILVEEEFLLKIFGNDYRDYVSRIPCFFPRFSLWDSAKLKWRWKMVLSREQNSIAAIIFSFVVVEHIRLFIINKGMKASLEWLIFGGIGVLVWLMLRFLKKFTRLLREDK